MQVMWPMTIRTHISLIRIAFRVRAQNIMFPCRKMWQSILATRKNASQCGGNHFLGHKWPYFNSGCVKVTFSQSLFCARATVAIQFDIHLSLTMLSASERKFKIGVKFGALPISLENIRHLNKQKLQLNFNIFGNFSLYKFEHIQH